MLLSWVLTLTVVLAFPLKASGSIEQKRVKLGDPVTLRCNISLHHEIFWLRVSMMERPRIIMVSRLKNDGELTEVLNYDRTHYEGCLMDRFFGLRIFSVLKSDLGSYYCGIVEGKRMEFEDGVHLHAFSSPVPDERQSSYPVFATILGVGLLMMVMVVFIVQMMTCRKNN
ncbi:hypothetical protein Q7C36_007723 [Tachysurus vachellii]|uniref:Immunoglobulin domain-containing protein n=1 Tax=Tachysurus vachellii TaxID=175792 RepID=A0AA88N8V8_TACVA|nr:hypothetical protein Q7C36_007723 [Tachysurus vachellii]